MKKILLLITLSISIANIYGQGWTTCSTTSGTLSGTSTDITINQSTVTPIYVTSPSPTGNIPQNDFLIILHDSLAFDSLGNTIINSNNNGIVTPSSLGLIINDTISVVSFSYDIQQFKLFAQGLLWNSVPLYGSCCSILDIQQTMNSAICDTLNAYGIHDSSEVNTIQDVINIVSICIYRTIKPLSLRGLNNGLININATIGTLNSIGCTQGVGEICYALDSLTSNHDQYVVISSCTNTNSTITETACDSYTSPSGNHTWTSSNTYMDTISNAAGCDSIITINLTINNSSAGTDTRTECNSYTWIDGTTYTTNNNSATYNIIGGAVNGCDSLVTLDLTINNVSDLTTSTSGETITANNSSSTYRWLDCDDDFAIISNETNQSFTATSNGSYAVELTENGCADTTNCVSIITVGIIENDFENELLLYPNPTYGDFSIDLGKNYQAITITITDLGGKVILSKTFNDSQLLNLKLEEPAGIYLLNIESVNNNAVIRLIKE